MDWQTCPRCKSSRYRNPSLVLKVNVCGHCLCENCVNQLFNRGSGPCPQCQVILKKDKFRVQFFEDAEMDKEVDIRRKVTQELFLREEDFPSLRAYNDYLEEVEGFIFNLVSGTDLEGTRRAMDAMKDTYKKGLQNSRWKKSNDQVFLEELVEKERASNDEVSRHAHDSQREEEIRKAKEKDQLLDLLQDSDMSAESVLADHKRKRGILDVEERYHVVPEVRPKQVIEEPPPIITAADAEWFLLDDRQLCGVEDDLNGPPVLSPDSLAAAGFLRSIRETPAAELAMGFTCVFPARRALLAAFDGLYNFQK
ncbi:CDK-activating kinase assembly factor MAT1 [Hypsibius exemplaris]|uniref:CDK-activating kinase assembly factor MAT1 n=1 Tax=Hypsibius exemplaris TaxID=2072580 RepID=A0A1W0WJN1_HYPEX|nr:CDK-activating kinase assembly factor MAT1 [Hypsibius exemplaris]